VVVSLLLGVFQNRKLDEKNVHPISKKRLDNIGGKKVYEGVAFAAGERGCIIPMLKLDISERVRKAENGLPLIPGLSVETAMEGWVQQT
jgi:hypothetical protein